MSGSPEVGEMIVYCTFSGMRRAVEVTAVHEVVKNGRPGFDGMDRSVRFPRLARQEYNSRGI